MHYKTPIYKSFEINILLRTALQDEKTYTSDATIRANTHMPGDLLFKLYISKITLYCLIQIKNSSVHTHPLIRTHTPEIETPP